MDFDALLVLSFGGPEGPDDVMPFLANVTRGRGVPEDRLTAVAAHYQRFGGVSPINARDRELIAALAGVVELPIYWGNRNWHPLLGDTVRRMTAEGIHRAVCFTTSAYSGYSSCRQYLEDIDAACAAVDGAPEIAKLRPFFDHPGFIGPFVDATTRALDRIDETFRSRAHLVFSAHSIPVAQPAAGDYEAQVREAARLVAARVPGDHPWSVAWQSRSGSPGQPWLEPDVGDHLAALAGAATPAVVIVPVGFVADHLEVVYDLDVVAAERAAALGLPLARAATPGVELAPMVAALIAERRDPAAPRIGLGSLPRAPCPHGDGCSPSPPGTVPA